MKKIVTFILALSALFSCKIEEDSVYLFSYFTDNGQDGLHLAYSHDGLTWEALDGGNSFLTPMVGKDKLMRDPSIVQDEDDRGLVDEVLTCIIAAMRPIDCESLPLGTEILQK